MGWVERDAFGGGGMGCGNAYGGGDLTKQKGEAVDDRSGRLECDVLSPQA